MIRISDIYEDADSGGGFGRIRGEQTIEHRGTGSRLTGTLYAHDETHFAISIPGETPTRIYTDADWSVVQPRKTGPEQFKDLPVGTVYKLDTGNSLSEMNRVKVSDTEFAVLKTRGGSTYVGIGAHIPYGYDLVVVTI